MSFDLDAAQIRQLLDELDRRLGNAGIAATVYVVGGAAISLHLPDTDRRTPDIDGITTDDGVAALATVLQVDPQEAVQLTLKASGADALEAITTPEDVTYDAQPPTGGGIRKPPRSWVNPSRATGIMCARSEVGTHIQI